MDFTVLPLVAGILLGALATSFPMLLMNKKALDKATGLVIEARIESWSEGFEDGWEGYKEMLAESLDSAAANGDF